MTDEVLLDVSELEPPAPLERILDALETLAAGKYLRVLHRREPWPLFDMIEAQGFAHHLQAIDPPGFAIVIWRSCDDAAEAAVRRHLARV